VERNPEKPEKTERGKPMISILSVNWNALKWMELLVKSVRKFSTSGHEFIIVDNQSEDGSAEWLAEQGDIKSIRLSRNAGHGSGLDLALERATGRYCLALDIDSHLQRPHWEKDLISLFEEGNPRLRLIAAKGGDPGAEVNAKPIHACFMFFGREFFIDNGLSFVARDGYDVGRKIYYDIARLGYETMRVQAGYEPNGRKFYPGAYGDDYYISGHPTVYHNWYASRMYKARERVDSYEKAKFEEDKNKLFDQPFIRKILES
jgi:glycosyltransferase involved in cell wall biosynthesis